MAYWWCLHHATVEGEDGCPHAERLGPYASADEAADALLRAQQRTDAWDRNDKEWNGQ